MLFAANRPAGMGTKLREVLLKLVSTIACDGFSFEASLFKDSEQTWLINIVLSSASVGR